MKILVVEPNAKKAEHLYQLLLLTEYKNACVEYCSSLKQILDSNRYFDLIFVNLHLPDSKGIGTIRSVRERYRQSQIITLSALGNENEAIESIKYGAADYLVTNTVDKKSLEKVLSCARARKEAKNISSAPDYKRFFDENPLPMWIYDATSFSFLAVNKAAIQGYGYSEDEFLSMTIFDIRPEEEKKLLKSTIDTIERQDGYTDVGYWRHTRKTGEQFFVHVYSHQTVYKRRKALMAVLIDVNNKILVDRENKKLHETIKSQKEQMDDILASVKDTVWSCRADTYDLVYINDACHHTFGYTSEEMKADTNLFFNAIHPDDKPKFMASFKEMFAKGHVTNEFRIYHKDGSIKYLTGTATLRRGHKGEPDVFSGVSFDITALKNAERELKEKVTQIENILESTTDSFLAVDKTWKMTYANKEFEKLFKKRKKELIGKNLWKTFPALRQSSYYEYFTHAMDKWGSVHYEGLSPSSGKIVSVNLYPTDNGLAVYMRDVTQERTMQDMIINEEKKLRAIINNTEDIIWLVDINLNTLAANQAYNNKLAMIAADHSDLYQARIEKWKNYYQRAMMGKLHRVIDEDTIKGKFYYHEISFNRIFDNNNNLTALSCFSRDITEEKKLQDKIMMNEQNLRALINNTNDFIWSVDKNLNIISINEPFQDFVYAFTNRILKPGDSIIFDDFGPEIKNKWINQYKKALSGKRVVWADEEVIAGQTYRKEIRLHPITNPDGNITGVSCFARDISALLEKMKMIQEQNDRLNEIAAIQSHKVRGPLSSILGLVELFNTSSIKDPANYEVVAGIKAASEELDKVIKEIVSKSQLRHEAHN